MARIGRLLGFVLVLALAAAAGYRHWRSKNISSVQRGFTVAHERGCFTCHGPGGLRGMANPGYGLDEIPPFAGGLITMYAQSEAEIREWILDGMPQRIRSDAQQMKLREKSAIRMPAWRGLMDERELHDLVNFVKAVSDFEKPKDEKADEGRKVAERYGCFNCHGPQGRGTMPNVRAFKGYIPAWDGDDFPELAANDAEIREWIQDGVSKRFAGNALAQFFLKRQPIHMPAYRAHLKPEEIDQLIDYIRWVRANRYR